jgi:transglutaminase-like putative cysteine protease
MRLQIEHRTTFEYSELVSEMLTEMRLRPVNSGGQLLHSFGLTLNPSGPVFNYVDRFGNDVRHFNVLTPLTRVSVLSVSQVTTTQVNFLPEIALSPLDAFDYHAGSHFVTTDPAHALFAPVTPGQRAKDAAYAIMATIHGQFVYEPGSTSVQTSAAEALTLKRGVCQDFAHAMIAVCRAQGIAARYVSGYLYSARAEQRDDAASHAWVDIYAPGEGWYALDPTHNCAQNDHYVRLGVGRDYADTPPTRGTFKGSASEALSVKVSVREV